MLMLKKTKIVIFPKGPDPKHTIKFNDEVIEIVKIFYYLSILQRKKKTIFVTRQKNPCTALLEKYDYINFTF